MKFPLDDIGSLTSPKGSRDWSSAVRLRIQVLIHDTSEDQKALRRWLDKMKTHRGWESLEDATGRQFNSFEAFALAPPPYGLGCDPEALAKLTADGMQDMDAPSPRSRPAGAKRGGR